VKNLPDEMNDAGLRAMFEKFGEIRSVKTVKKELTTSYLGIKRSVKVFGFVCFFKAEEAREAKQALNAQNLQGQNTNTKLFVDYHQTKQERSEYLKLKVISQSNKMFQKGGKPGQEVPMMMRNMPPNMRQFNNPGFFGPQYIRKFPPQTGFVQPNMGQRMNPQMQGQGFQGMDNMLMDKNARRDYFGERLYTKISSNPQFSQLTEYFSKIVGIFLDLDDQIIERLIQDDGYFFAQVNETVRLLNEKTG